MKLISPRENRRQRGQGGTQFPTTVERGKKPYRFYLRDKWDEVILHDGWDSGDYTDYIGNDILDFEHILVVDVGANFGAFTAYCRNRWPHCVVHSFEPTPGTAQRFIENIGDDENVFFHEAALYGNVKPTKIIEEPGTNHGANRVGYNGPQEIETASIHGFLAGDGHIDILKLDCEFSEDDILMSLSDEELGRIRYIVGEYHSMEIMTRLQQHLGATHDGEWIKVHPNQGLFRMKLRST